MKRNSIFLLHMVGSEQSVGFLWDLQVCYCGCHNLRVPEGPSLSKIWPPSLNLAGYLHDGLEFKAF